VVGASSRLLARLPRTPFGPLNSLLQAGALPPELLSSILHGVLVGPVAPTLDQREAIEAPTLVLAHRFDLIHPFDDALNLVSQVRDGRLVRARSPLELRLQPERLTGEIVAFLDEVWAPNRTVAQRETAGRSRRTGGPRQAS
jgi:hypothetical protein